VLGALSLLLENRKGSPDIETLAIRLLETLETRHITGRYGADSAERKGGASHREVPRCGQYRSGQASLAGYGEGKLAVTNEEVYVSAALGGDDFASQPGMEPGVIEALVTPEKLRAGSTGVTPEALRRKAVELFPKASVAPPYGTWQTGARPLDPAEDGRRPPDTPLPGQPGQRARPGRALHERQDDACAG